MKKSKFLLCNKLFSPINYHQLLLQMIAYVHEKLITNKNLSLFHNLLFITDVISYIDKIVFLSQLRPMGNNKKMHPFSKKKLNNIHSFPIISKIKK